jgi:hypothetical protein
MASPEREIKKAEDRLPPRRYSESDKEWPTVRDVGARP